MQIYVNEKELDAKLDGEKTLAEVYEAINRWSVENKKYILNLRVDDEDVSPHRLGEIATDAVERMDFFIGDEMDMVLSTLAETDRYIDQIGAILFEQQVLNGSDISNLLEGVHWMNQIMNSVAGILHLDLNRTNSPLSGGNAAPEDSIGETIKRLTTMAEGLEEGAGRDQIEGFLAELRTLKLFVMALILQLRTMSAGREQLVEQVEEFEARIPELSEEIVSINEGFNGGKDAEALQTLESITEVLNTYISALFALDWQMRQNGDESINNVLIDGVSFQSRAETLTSLLRDLSNALEEGDIVAVGDILEYELTEQLKEIRPYLARIREVVS